MSSSESPVTIKQLQDSIDTWASANTSELVLYMTGRGSSGYFQLNSTENLSVSELDQWLDKLQSQTNIRIILIFDSDYSGGFLPLLLPDSGKTRIIIASASEDQPAAFPEGDQLSFSVFFWDSILNGESVGNHFSKQKRQLRSSLRERNNMRRAWMTTAMVWEMSSLTVFMP
ncbi:MAG: hypothetical protein HC887_01165 [Desulfobacteraceae bacterium]|nr:hypothetical protein [Desulfobacteraceae bacterium]